MAEGFSFKPDEEATDTTHETTGAKRADTLDRFKLFLGDLFKPKEKQEDEDDDVETSGRKGRFARAWKRLFGGAVVQRENIETGQQETTPRNGLFFELSPTETRQPDRERPEAVAPVRESVSSQSERPATDATEASTSEPVQELEQRTSTQTEGSTEESRRSRVESERQANDQERPQEVVRERYYAVGPTALERARMRKLENDQRRLERDVRKAKDSTEKLDTKRRSVEQRTVTSAETREPAQQVRTVEALRPVRPEVVRAAKRNVERVPEARNIERQPTELKEVPKEAFKAEKIYNVPESVQKVVERIEKDDAKEIAYELSHEHKDLDKQSATALALLQQQADDRAKAALISMQNAGKTTQSQKNKMQKDAENSSQQQIYQQAALGGFIAAVVIFAIVLVLLLLK